MHILKINAEKSIKMHRVVYKLTSESVFQYIFLYFLAWILPALSIQVTLFKKIDGHYLFDPYFGGGTFFMVLVDLFILINLYLMNKMFVFEGKTFEENKIAIKAVLKESYPEMLLASTAPNVIRGQIKVGYQRDRVITVVLNENKVFVNVLNTYRGNGFSFFHGWVNYYRSKSLSDDFIFKLFS